MGWCWIPGMSLLLSGCCGTLPAKSASASSSIPLTQPPPRMAGIKEKFLLHILGCHPQPLPQASSPAAELEENVLEQAWSASGEIKKPEREEKSNRRSHVRVPGKEFGRFSTA